MKGRIENNIEMKSHLMDLIRNHFLIATSHVLKAKLNSVF